MDCHYRIRKWSLRSEITPGQKNVAHPDLGNKLNIYWPPLHIKLGLINIYVTAMGKESEEFAYLMQKFPKINEAKTKEGIFVCPQITQLFEDHDFSTKLNSTQRRAWKPSENV
jgi:hypothetical protein